MTIRIRSALLLPLLLAACSPRRQAQAPPVALTPGDHSLTLRHEGRTRTFIVHVPAAAATGTALPVLLAFHGGGGNAAGFRDYARLDALADREAFLVIYPDGTGPLADRLLTWNAGGCCGWAREHDIDDVGFALAIIDDLARRTPIEERRVYATGHSNGAMMAYRLAAERADRIAAIAPVAGAMTLDAFSPSRAVPVLHIHSVDDPRALYQGGLGPPFPLTTTRVLHEPVQASLDAWIAADRCAQQPAMAETRQGQPGQPDASHTATLLVWAPCSGGARIEHWRLTGAGHGWPGGPGGLPATLIGPETHVIDAATEVWRFVSRYSLP